MALKKILASAFILPLAFALAGCQEKEGPAEKAGKELDKAASALGDKLESAGEQIESSIAR